MSLGVDKIIQHTRSLYPIQCRINGPKRQCVSLTTPHPTIPHTLGPVGIESWGPPPSAEQRILSGMDPYPGARKKIGGAPEVSSMSR